MPTPSGNRDIETPQPGWVTETPTPPVHITNGLVVAGVFARVVAYGLDTFLLTGVSIAFFGVFGLFAADADPTVALAVGAVLVGIELVYFVVLWTSGLQASLGMRLLRLRVVSAGSAGRISLNDAVLRWLALSGAFGILSLVPSLGPTFATVSLVWVVLLLYSTRMHPLNQGFHDRWARSIVAQPAPGGSGAAVVGCFGLIFLTLAMMVVLAAIAGPQLEQYLPPVQQSI